MRATSLENASSSWSKLIVQKFNGFFGSMASYLAVILMAGFGMTALSVAEARAGSGPAITGPANSQLAFLSQQPADEAGPSEPTAAPPPPLPPDQPHFPPSGSGLDGFPAGLTSMVLPCANK